MPRKLLPPCVLLVALSLIVGCRHYDARTFDRLIVGEVMLDSQLPENLRALCLPGGRLSGTDNGHRAGEFVADKLREYGLKNVHLETFEMPGWRSGETIVTVLGDAPTRLEGAIALWNTLGTPPEGITADLINVGDGKEEDFEQLGDAISGKFVLVNDGGDRRADKMHRALERGAAGLVIVSQPEREPIIGTCHKEPRPEPGLVIRHEDGESLAEKLAAGESVQLNVQITAEVWDAEPRNVVGEIAGCGPLRHETVILCAHLDSWHLAEGAIDNGNGSAAILESARALAAVGWKPRRTVRFIWFMGEEQGLFGSQAYVAAHADELDDVVAVVNVDMPGSPRSLATSGSDETIAFLSGVREGLRGYELNEKIGKLSGSFSDHAPFLDAGVCTMTLWGDLGDGVRNYHTAGDKYEIVDRRATVESAAVLGVLMRQLADRDTP